MSQYARTKPGSGDLYYLPEFEVLYVGGKPTIVYRPIQLKLMPVVPEEINETLEYLNDENNWIAVDKKHYNEIKKLYGGEQSENKLDFIRQLSKQAWAHAEQQEKRLMNFEAFYNQLAAIPSKKII